MIMNEFGSSPLSGLFALSVVQVSVSMDAERWIESFLVVWQSLRESDISQRASEYNSCCGRQYKVRAEPRVLSDLHSPNTPRAHTRQQQQQFSLSRALCPPPQLYLLLLSRSRYALTSARFVAARLVVMMVVMCVGVRDREIESGE